MTTSSNFGQATDMSLDQFDKTTRRVDMAWRGSESLGNTEKMMTLLGTQQSMQFALTEVDLAVKRRNSFTTKIVSEIR